jgi:hypothetical protein
MFRADGNFAEIAHPATELLVAGLLDVGVLRGGTEACHRDRLPLE